MKTHYKIALISHLRLNISSGVILFSLKVLFNPIQDGLFRYCSLMEGEKKLPPLPKICRTYPAMMQIGRVIFYLKKI